MPQNRVSSLRMNLSATNIHSEEIHTTHEDNMESHRRRSADGRDDDGTEAVDQRRNATGSGHRGAEPGNSSDDVVESDDGAGQPGDRDLYNGGDRRRGPTDDAEHRSRFASNRREEQLDDEYRFAVGDDRNADGPGPGHPEQGDGGVPRDSDYRSANQARSTRRRWIWRTRRPQWIRRASGQTLSLVHGSALSRCRLCYPQPTP